MIRYLSNRASIEAAIDGVSANWRSRATAQTKEMMKIKSFVEGKVGWSEIKHAYLDMQYNKCIFCESPAYTPERGTYNLDVEHFRPKNEVPSWPKPNSPLKYEFSTGGNGGSYYWLALEPTNYAVACKECNSKHKSNFFPIAGNRGQSGSHPTELITERPFLCYPLGDWDDDPEEIITFDGTIAIPASDDAARRRRALVIIDFFKLNERDALQRERAQFIIFYGNFLKILSKNPADDKVNRIIDKMDDPATPHANCMRSFKRTWNSDMDRGKKILDKCVDLYFGF